MQADEFHVGIDWGTSSFRAFLFDQNYTLIDQKESAAGIQRIDSADYETTLFSLTDDWLHKASSVLLSGMITSRNGWVETPYVPVPANLDILLNHCAEHTARGVGLTFMPGMSQEQPRHDVMRGEEIQLVGVSQQHESALVVMPGTHSKWAFLDSGRLNQFRTIPTGELFDFLVNDSTIGQLATNKKHQSTAFTDGVNTGFATQTIMSELFHCRAGTLLGSMQTDAVYSTLSGMLIGNEIREALALDESNNTSRHSSVVLVGSSSLCDLYAEAFRVLRMDVSIMGADLTARSHAIVLQRMGA